MKILIADDEQISRMVLQRTLKALDFEVDIASDGAEAWELFQRHTHPIVIADWVMPGLDGIELCRRIRTYLKEAYTYVILLTSKYEKQDRLTGLSAGADDFIVKPFDRGELSARLGVAERILQMESQLREANRQVQLVRRQEIEIGAHIQRTLLMARPPEGTNCFEFAAMNLPSSQIDGDFFDFFVHRSDLVDIFVGDAMGKGVPAALIGAGTKSTMLRSISRLLADRSRQRVPSPREIVQTAHASLARELMRLNSFVTLCYARLDGTARLATFVDCGHTKVIHWSATAGKAVELSGTNFPVGFVQEEVYGEYSVPFDIGDVFCFYSDGVTDAMSPSGEFFGMERLTHLINTYAQESPSQILYRLREAIRKHTNDRDLDDDFTVVIVRAGSGVDTWQSEMRIFPSVLESLSEIRHFIGYLSLDCGLTVRDIDELQIAAHEACTNIIIHAHQRRGVDTVEVFAERLSNGIRVRLAYDGPGFAPPGEVEPPEMTVFREGGLGLYIIDRSVNSAVYGTDESGRRFIELIKRAS